jgi:guanylate kinase
LKTRVILVGKAAAGKDHARKICEQWLGMPYQVSYTTRPPRDGEQDGKDYNFISMDTAIHEYINKDKFFEHVVFNGWIYGTTKEQFYTKGSVFIMTPTGLSHLSETDRAESLVIYFDIEEEKRKERMYERAGNADSVERRLVADREDFKDFSNYDVKVSNPNFYITDIAEIIRKHMAIKPLQFAEKFTEN